MLGPIAHLFFMAPPLRAIVQVLRPLSLNIDLALVHSFIVSLHSAPRTIFQPPTGFCHMYNLANSMVAIQGKGLYIGLILMAHQVSSAPLLYNNGALVGGAPLVWKTLMAHQAHGAPLVLIFFHFSIHSNGAWCQSAPLLVLPSNGAPCKQCTISI